MNIRFLLAAALLALPAGAATLELTVTGRDGAPVENAVVYAVPGKPMPLARKVAVMDQVNRTFVPHVLPVQTGTWVEFPNSDNVRHQVFSISPARRFSTPLYVGKPARPIQFPTAGVVALGCTVHEQMSAYVVVVDTPYFATSDKRGKSSIENVEPGEYKLRIWYPQMSKEPAAQSVRVGDEAKLAVTVTTD